MLKSKLVGAGIILSVATVLALPETALAQKKKQKVSFEQAWKLCKAYLDKEGGGLTANPMLGPDARTPRGKACMQKYGYRI